MVASEEVGRQRIKPFKGTFSVTDSNLQMKSGREDVTTNGLEVTCRLLPISYSVVVGKSS